MDFGSGLALMFKIYAAAFFLCGATFVGLVMLLIWVLA